ncbi:class I SAM-dependent methyltransferase [Streptomyces mirabilis]
MTVFAGTSACFRRFRPGIPVAPAAFLDQAAPTDRSWRLLDVGTGPGLVVHALLSYFDDLIAVDVELAMLTEAEALLRPALDTAHRLQLRHALAEDFLPREGWQPPLVTCERVFHWLDKAASSTVRVTARSALRDRRIRHCWAPPTFRSSPLRFFPFAANGRSPRSSAICTRHRSRPHTCSATAAAPSRRPSRTPLRASPTAGSSWRTTRPLCTPLAIRPHMGTGDGYE